MSKLSLRGRDLREIGYPQGPVISKAIEIMTNLHPRGSKKEVLLILKMVLTNPKAYENDEKFSAIATELLPKPRHENEIDLENQGVPFHVYGADFIEPAAIDQMQQASRLPISVAGALMPDAHHGYGLPIGGVLATNNAIIPYGVGVDIGCRMCLSLFELPVSDLKTRDKYFKRMLQEHALFGAGKEFKKTESHEVLDRKEFYESGLLRNLHDRAAKQLGTSGSGNHFVEFGIATFEQHDAQLGIPPGAYLALLSHSGSRALGANIAQHYTKKAKEMRMLPKEAANLAW